MSKTRTPEGYAGRRIAGRCFIWARFRAGHRPLTPARSARVWNHSPTGFEWGYGGSGPAQTALAILLHFTRDRELSIRLHQDFKCAFVAGWGDSWRISAGEITHWLEEH